MYVLLDARDCIMGLTKEDIGGTTGWVEVTQKALTSHTGRTVNELMDHLSNEHGIPLYKYEKRYAEKRTDEEIAADEKQLPLPAPTSEERLCAVEEAMLFMMEVGV